MGPGPVWKCGKSRPHRDSIPNRPARSQWQYRLSYTAHIYIYITCEHHVIMGHDSLEFANYMKKRFPKACCFHLQGKRWISWNLRQVMSMYQTIRCNTPKKKRQISLCAAMQTDPILNVHLRLSFLSVHLPSDFDIFFFQNLSFVLQSCFPTPDTTSPSLHTTKPVDCELGVSSAQSHITSTLLLPSSSPTKTYSKFTYKNLQPHPMP